MKKVNRNSLYLGREMKPLYGAYWESLVNVSQVHGRILPNNTHSQRIVYVAAGMFSDRRFAHLNLSLEAIQSSFTENLSVFLSTVTPLRAFIASALFKPPALSIREIAGEKEHELGEATCVVVLDDKTQNQIRAEIQTVREGLGLPYTEDLRDRIGTVALFQLQGERDSLRHLDTVSTVSRVMENLVGTQIDFSDTQLFPVHRH